MSRDALRSEVAKLKLIEPSILRKMKTNELRNILLFPYHDDYFEENNQPPRQQKRQVANNNREKLKDIFPFQNQVFRKVKEFRDSIKNTEYSSLNIEAETLDDYLDKVQRFVLTDIIPNKKLKIYFGITIESTFPNTKEIIRFDLATSSKILLPSGNKKEFYQEHCSEILEEYDRRAVQKSNLSFVKVSNFGMIQAIYKSLGGYFNKIEIPKELANKNVLVNIQNQKNKEFRDKCLGLSIIACLHPVNNNRERISNYTKYWDNYNWNGVNWP
jgi:hypothetical protein